MESLADACVLPNGSINTMSAKTVAHLLTPRRMTDPSHY
jgi:hypothetical protein